MVCLDFNCKKQNLVCGACIEESHNGHKVKPFKIILDEVNQRVDKIKTQKIDTAELLELIDKNKEVIFNFNKKDNYVRFTRNYLISNIKIKRNS